jgi:hypothetical protein
MCKRPKEATHNTRRERERVCVLRECERERVRESVCVMRERERVCECVEREKRWEKNSDDW